MATIKDVAQMAGVSVTTVSIIINGKTEERRISAATKEKVLSVMNELGYQPNLSARRLRYSETKKPAIAFYWPMDYRINILASFINCIQKELNAQHFDCELVIQTYENDHLEKKAAPIIKSGYNGIIIGATSHKDMEYLEALTPQIPIVLINRVSEKYSTVCVDSKKVGFMAARLFKEKGYREAAVIVSDHPYVAMGNRTQAFLSACSELGILVKPDHIIRGDGTITGGVEAAEAYCRMDKPPKAIFLESDSMALGALYTFHKNHVSVPGDVELLSIAMLGEEATRFSIPALSVIDLSNDSISRAAVHILIHSIEHSDFTPVHIPMEPELILRDSFRIGEGDRDSAFPIPAN